MLTRRVKRLCDYAFRAIRQAAADKGLGQGLEQGQQLAVAAAAAAVGKPPGGSGGAGTVAAVQAIPAVGVVQQHRPGKGSKGAVRRGAGGGEGGKGTVRRGAGERCRPFFLP